MRRTFLCCLYLTAVAAVLGADDPVKCNFDINMCNWYQKTDDNFDWIRQQGGTATRETGPLSDHTTGKGYYLYTEVSTLASNRTARIQSKSAPSAKTDQCLTFWYNMNGDHIGTLNVYIITTLTLGKPEWTRTGEQGLNWKQGSITIAQGHAPFAVVIEGVSGDGYRGDIAIDDIDLQDGTCSSVVVTGPAVHTTVSPGQIVRVCDFEMSNICNYVQDKTDDFDWTWSSEPTTSYGTGPEYDHTYGTSSGYYLFTEASDQKPGNKARIMTPFYHDGSAMCVQFFYHMYGDGMGTLSVYAKTNGGSLGNAVFTVNGNYGNKWIKGQATIPASTATSSQGYQVVFEGTIGGTYKSDIGIDDVSFKAGVCPKQVNPQSSQIPYTQKHVSGTFDCVFGSNNKFCGWTQVSESDEFDWKMSSGPTLTQGTGPISGDHTYGYLDYIYIETSGSRKVGDKAQLYSPQVQAGQSCITWWYNMFGCDVGSLNVYIQTGAKLPTAPAWTLSGNQGYDWHEGHISVNINQPYKVVFEGVRGDGYLGDIALDDMKLTKGSCPTGSYKQAIDVKCFRPGWTVTVNLTELSPRPKDISKLSMGTDSCTGRMQGDLVVFDKAFRECNTHFQVLGRKVMLTNSIQYAGPTISHTSNGAKWTDLLRCDHPLNAEGTFSVYNNTRKGSHICVGGGLPFHVTVFNDSAFTDQLQQPISGSPVYVQVISLSHPDLAMALDSCAATVKTTNPTNEKSFTLIDQSCAVKSTTRILTTKNQLTQFKFEMFDLPKDYTGIYINCKVHFCDGNCDHKCHFNPQLIG